MFFLKNSFWFEKYIYFFLSFPERCVWVCVWPCAHARMLCTYVCVCMCRVHWTICRYRFSPPTWSPGAELRSSGWAGGAFALCVLYQALPRLFWRRMPSRLLLELAKTIHQFRKEFLFSFSLNFVYILSKENQRFKKKELCTYLPALWTTLGPENSQKLISYKYLAFWLINIVYNFIYIDLWFLATYFVKFISENLILCHKCYFVF